ncbi:MAG: PFL family protein [Pyrinomonadaceae bacterium MAG19_C2-C3]|nr:PFL family protein [Pyrinomonadaceae bacterium MAG19_C2-C3]
MEYTQAEILQTVRMTEMENLDIRTVTLGLSLRDCVGDSVAETASRVKAKINKRAARLVSTVNEIGDELGIAIANKRISITPVSLLGGGVRDRRGFVELAHAIDEAAAEVGVDFIGGYSALVHKGFTNIESEFFDSVPEALATTARLCSSVNVATTRAGINMDAVARVGHLIKDAATRTRETGGLACAKFVCFANAVEDNPFMAGAFHGVGEAEAVINVGVSGPGVVAHAMRHAPKDAPLDELAELIKKLSFKLARAGELIGREAARRLNVPFGIIDLSLAPTPKFGDSVAEIIEAMGFERVGAHGTTAALALLTDAVKKGGAMASSNVGGMSGAFIPVSEDARMIEAAQLGALTLEKLEAWTSVCSVGLDMVAVPGDTSAETLSAIIADEMAIGVMNHKTTAVRIIPVPGKTVGDFVEFGGLLGSAPVMSVNGFSCEQFIRRGGRIPAPIHSLRN